MEQGWYDAQGQGVANDYCRMVGDGSPWFSCALAGTPVGNGGCAYTAPGEYLYDSSTGTITNPHVTYGGIPATIDCMDPQFLLCSNPHQVTGVIPENECPVKIKG